MNLFTDCPKSLISNNVHIITLEIGLTLQISKKPSYVSPQWQVFIPDCLLHLRLKKIWAYAFEVGTLVIQWKDWCNNILSYGFLNIIWGNPLFLLAEMMCECVMNPLFDGLNLTSMWQNYRSAPSCECLDAKN